MESLPATISAMKEISVALVSITLVMSAVFVPVAFMSGPVGVFYKQFSITMAIAIVISGVNALTLTPALCVMMLKPQQQLHTSTSVVQKFFRWFNSSYERNANRFSRALSVIVNRKTVTYSALILFIVISWTLGNLLPTGFIPTEDQGVIYANVTTPSGSTLERTEAVMTSIETVARRLDEVEGVSTLAGFSLFTDGAGASFGMCMISLKSWHQRKKNVDEIIELLIEKTAYIRDASIQFFPPPAVPGYGNTSGFELRIQDQGGNSLQALEQTAKQFVAELNKQPQIRNSFTSFDASFPQYLVTIDHDKAAQKGVTVNNAMNNLQALIGSYYATNFIRFGQLYKVMLQALPKYRALPEDVLNLFVKNNRGEMVPYSTFMSIERVYGPEQLTRYNMYNSAMINGEPAPGFSSGEAIEAIKRTAHDKLPRGYDLDWTGMTRDEIDSGNQAIYIFAICLLFVYLLLAAQYESFVLPFSVILSLPCGIAGAWFLLWVLGLQNNIYAQVALVMLIGLLGKNAILIVEFARQRLLLGETPAKAAVSGALSRLRPILMTSFAFIAGLIPLLVASGAGALGNRTIGTAAAGGMFFGTIFGVFLIPGLFLIFCKGIKAQHSLQQITVREEGEAET